MEWGSTDSVVSIPSGRGRLSRGGFDFDPATPTVMDGGGPIEEDEQHHQHQSHGRSASGGASATPRAKRSTSGNFATSPAPHSTTKKTRHSGGGGSGSGNFSKLLPPSSGYGTASYNPYLTHSPNAAASASASNGSLYAAYTSAHAATAAPAPTQQTTRYLGMQAPKTEWLLPTRVSVQERSTATTAAKLSYKSPKADKSWKGYIPANQSHAFDLRVHHPKVLETPLAPLPGSKNDKYDGAIQRLPVSEATTRATVYKRSEKSFRARSGLMTQAQILEEEIESRRADKRARFELETERAKESLWRESAFFEQKQVMLTEERTYVAELRQKVRQARADREERWKQDEMKMRQKENLELRIPEARLAKYERWLREEQEVALREKYLRETGEQAPPGYGKQAAPEDAGGVDKDDDGAGSMMDESILATPQLPSLPRFPPPSSTLDQGRFVESSYHHGSSSTSIGIEFKMLSENDPDAHAPLFAPSVFAASSSAAGSVHHSRGPSVTPSHHQRGQSGGHRPHASYGSIGNLSQLGMTEAQLQQDGTIETDGEDDAHADERKYSAHDTPEISGHFRQLDHHHHGPSTSVHMREMSHSARNDRGGVSFALEEVDDDDADTEDVRPSRSGRPATTMGEENSREASRALRGVREEDDAKSSSLAIDAANADDAFPPVIGTPDEWDHDENVLTIGIQAIKIPRKKSMFGGSARQITLHLSQSKASPNWILQWDSKSKKSENEFINLSEGLKSYKRGIAHGALETCGKEAMKKYQERANHCYTLHLSDRTLDLVLLNDSDSDAFHRLLSRIDHPSGAHRTPRASPSSTSTATIPKKTQRGESPAASSATRVPVGASATAHGAMSVHDRPQTTGLAGAGSPSSAAVSATGTNTGAGGANNTALLLAMSAQTQSPGPTQSSSQSHSNHPNSTPTGSPASLSTSPLSHATTLDAHQSVPNRHSKSHSTGPNTTSSYITIHTGANA